MNERIRELAHEAGFFPELNWDHTAWHAAGHNDTFEKFAELIVRECIKEVEGLQVSNWNQNWNQAIAHTALHLKEHFGVEE